MSKQTFNPTQTQIVIVGASVPSLATASPKSHDKCCPGGGDMGSSAARLLSTSLDPAKYNLVLINSRPFYVFNIASARMVVSEEDRVEDSALIPYDKLFHNGNGTFVLGTVTAIRAGDKGRNVVLADGRMIPYDVLVLGPGSQWSGPLAFPNDPQEISAFIEDTRTKFQSSTHVAIAGGGAVGMGAPLSPACTCSNTDIDSSQELAGEIRDIWPVCAPTSAMTIPDI